MVNDCSSWPLAVGRQWQGAAEAGRRKAIGNFIALGSAVESEAVDVAEDKR
jgi:hypothetical protein